MKILTHPSMRGSFFSFRLGFSDRKLETLRFGHCLVVLPFIIDQGLNVRLLVEEIERGEDESFRREDIAKSLRFAMMSEKG